MWFWFWLWLCKLKCWWILLHLFCCRLDVFTMCLVEAWWSTEPRSVVECSRLSRCSCRCILALNCKLQWWRIMLQPKNSPLTLIVQKSYKSTYESTQTGNESTQTVIFPVLSRPGSQPVLAHDKMIERKIGNESTQVAGESTQLWISSIESTGRSTSSDPREPGSKKEEAWVDAKGWVSRLTQVSQNWVDRWVDLFVPGGFASSHESTHMAKNLQKWVFCNVTLLFAPFLYVVNILGIKIKQIGQLNENDSA